MIIGVVGACGAGKSSLVASLRARGFNVRHIAQEHSYVPDMWKRISHPDVLVYLEVSYENTIARRKLDWTFEEYTEQLRRLRHARQHAQLVLDTNPLTVVQVLESVIPILNPSNQPDNA